MKVTVKVMTEHEVEVLGDPGVAQELLPIIERYGFSTFHLAWRNILCDMGRITDDYRWKALCIKLGDIEFDEMMSSVSVVLPKDDSANNTNTKAVAGTVTPAPF